MPHAFKSDFRMADVAMPIVRNSVAIVFDCTIMIHVKVATVERLEGSAMRIDGGTKASSGQQTQLRFEQVMSRELSRSSSGRTPIESDIRTTIATSAKKKAPGSERVGANFKAPQAGKVLKGAQDSARQILSKLKMVAAQGSKTTFTKLGSAIDAAGKKAQTLKNSVMDKAFGKKEAGASKMAALGDSAGDAQAGKTPSASVITKGNGSGLSSPATQMTAPQSAGGQSAGGQGASLSSGGGPSTGTGMQGSGGPSAGSQTASTTAASTTAQTTPSPGSGTQTTASQSGQPIALRAEAQAMASGTERAGMTAPAATIAESAPASPAPASATEVSGAPEARPILTLQDAPTAQEALLLHGPGLQAVARKAKAGGSELSVVYQLGLNVHGAEFVSVTTDDKGFITGPEVDIALAEGATDARGNWVALSGEGTLQGAKITLRPDADGHAFVTEGEQGVPTSVTAWLEGDQAIHAEVTAVRKLR